MSGVGPICKTPLAQENYNLLMQGIDEEKKIHEENEKERKKLENEQQ